MGYENDNSGLDRKLKAAGIDIEVLKKKTITYSYFGQDPGKGVLNDVQMQLIQYISGSSIPRKILVKDLEGSFNPNYYHGGQNFCGQIDLYKALCEASANDSYSIQSFIEATLNNEVPTNINVITIDGKSYINGDGNHRMLFLKAMYEQELQNGKSQEELDEKYSIYVTGVEVPEDKEEQTCIGILGKLNSKIYSSWGRRYNTPCFEMIVEDGVCKGYILTVKETGEKVELRGKDALIKYTKEVVDKEKLNEMLAKLQRIDIVPFDLDSYSNSLELLEESEQTKLAEKYKVNAQKIMKVRKLLDRLKKKFESQEVTSENLSMIQQAFPDEYLRELRDVENASYVYQKLFYNDTIASINKRILDLITQDRRSEYDSKINELRNQRLGILDRLFGKENLRELQIKNLELQKNNFQVKDLDLDFDNSAEKILEEYISKYGMNQELREFILQNSSHPLIRNLIIPELFASQSESLLPLRKMPLREVSNARKKLETENERLSKKLNENSDANANNFEDKISVSQEEIELSKKILEFSDRLDQVLVLTGLEPEIVLDEHDEKE